MKSKDNIIKKERKTRRDYSYGYNDESIIHNIKEKQRPSRRILLIFLAILLIVGVWFFLNQKLLFGQDWISPTYDKETWRANEGNLHTYGAWDLETHVWKSQFILDNFPNFNWNPYWYMGMPLLKYYQSGFYIMNIGLTLLTGLTLARSALLMIIFAHLLAALMTFWVSYKVSRKPFLSGILSIFILSLSFMSLRSYGWEPITVVFLFFYPLGLLVFLKEPTRPLRLGLIIVLALSYLLHPLIFFSLAMTFGLYLFSIAVKEKDLKQKVQRPYILQYFILVFISLLISAVQFLPQFAYDQVTSGAHMGVSYIPFYHVKYNVISLYEFLFDAGNLKGPGFIILVSIVIVAALYFIERKTKITNKPLFKKLKENKKTLTSNEMIGGFLFVLLIMILFYYLERFNLFPMNLLRSIQYHRIIPEFVIASSVLIAAISNILDTKNKKVIYYAAIIAFAFASLVIIYNIQLQWDTSKTISNSQEFITDKFQGRITFPYTDQSLAVRNSFTNKYQVYGYYEQGITNPYADEIFSVSSGYQNIQTTILYLKATNVARVYINTEEGPRDEIMFEKLNGTLPFYHNSGDRYGYFEVPLSNPEMAQTVNLEDFKLVQAYEPGCRIMFQEKYCGSNREEFVSSDLEEIRYLEKYDELLNKNLTSNAKFNMIDPQHYDIKVTNASKDTAIVVKMTHDSDFSAKINGNEVPIETIGPDFMLITPKKQGDYTINLEYHLSKVVLIGGIISLLSLISVIIVFALRKYFSKIKLNIFELKKGDLD